MAVSHWEIRLKSICAVLWLILIMMLKSIAAPWVCTAILLLIVVTDRGIDVHKVLHQLWHISPFILLMLITLSISDGFPITKTALYFALLLCSRVIAAVCTVLVLIGGTEPEEFIKSLAVFRLPPTYLSVLFLTNRYVHLLVRDFRKQSMALKARMFVPKANPFVLKNIGYIVGGLFIRSYDRSQQVYSAMKSRCYDGVIRCDDPQSIKVKDIVLLVLGAAIAAAVFAAERLVIR